MSDEPSGQLSSGTRLCVFERQIAEGELQRTWLHADPLALQLGDDAPRLLPPGCLGRVFERYGQPFDEAEIARSSRQLEWMGELISPHGNVRRFRHRSWFDVVARDFVVYSPLPSSAGEHSAPGARFDLCTSVAAALEHLAAAYARAYVSPA